MKSSTRLAFFVFLGLAILVWQQTLKKQERGVSQITFAAVDVTKVDRIEISGPHAVTLVRKGDVWQLASGRMAEQNAVTRALESLEKIHSTKVVTRKSERYAELKVDAAQGAQVVVQTGEEVSAEFVIGSGGPGSSNVLVDGSVYTVKGVFPGTFSRPQASWVDKEILKIGTQDVAKVEIQLPGEAPFALVQSESKVVSLEDSSVLPSGFRFDHALATSVLNTLTGLRAREFMEPPADLNTWGLGDGASRFVIHQGTEGLAAQTVVLGGAAGENQVYAQLLPKNDVFTISSHSAKLLRRTPLEFRDLRLVTLEANTVDKLHIRHGKSKIDLTREAGVWKLAKAKPAPHDGFLLDPAAVDQLLATLGSVRGESLAQGVSPKKSGLRKSKQFIRWVATGGAGGQLRLGVKEKDTEQIFARGNADQGIYRLSQSVVGKLFGGLESLEKRAASDLGALGKIDPQMLNQLPPEIREQLLRQLQDEQRKQQMMQAFQEGRAPGQ